MLNFKMQVIITDRTRDVLKRAIEVYAPLIIQYAKTECVKTNKMDIGHRIIFWYQTKIQLWFEMKFETISKCGNMDYDEKCNCSYNYDFSRISYNCRVIVLYGNYEIGLGNELNFKSDYDLEDFSDFIDNLPDCITICKCKQNITTRGDKCDNCYIHQYTRQYDQGSVCSICNENGFRWDMLRCGHNFHTHCITENLGVGENVGEYSVKCRECYLISNLEDIVKDCFNT